jgi:acetaldehyde dehydrogenase (acetylating)
VAFISEQAGISVPAGTRALIAPLSGVGRDYPLSIEKLCPVLSYYVVKDWREGCERCIQILRYGGMGHTMSIHSRNEPVILEFGLKKPAFRICVNTPTTHGSIGLTTGLDPAMTLGCGGFGGNITSDNITPRHLLNIKRLAYETRPAIRRADTPGVSGSVAASAPLAGGSARLPQVSIDVEAGLPAKAVSRQIEAHAQDSRASDGSPTDLGPKPVDFVCEEDVRLAIKAGRRIVVDDRTLITPAARDLAGPHKIFVEQNWRRNR